MLWAVVSATALAAAAWVITVRCCWRWASVAISAPVAPPATAHTAIVARRPGVRMRLTIARASVTRLRRVEELAKSFFWTQWSPLDKLSGDVEARLGIGSDSECVLRSVRHSPVAPVLAAAAATAAVAAALAAPAPAAAERRAAPPPPHDPHHAFLPAGPAGVPAGDRAAVPTPVDVASPAGVARPEAGRARIADGSPAASTAAAHTPRARAPPAARAPTRAALFRSS